MASCGIRHIDVEDLGFEISLGIGLHAPRILCSSPVLHYVLKSTYDVLMKRDPNREPVHRDIMRRRAFEAICTVLVGVSRSLYHSALVALIMATRISSVLSCSTFLRITKGFTKSGHNNTRGKMLAM